MPRPKQRTPELRAEILTAALSLLDTDGVTGITTREVAKQANTSLPAVYELFGDKAGLVRAMFFNGFERLGEHLRTNDESDDPLADLRTSALAYRSFAQQNTTLFDVMYFQPFAAFDPGPDELAAGSSVREFVIARIERCCDAGLITSNAANTTGGTDSTDIAHGLLALILGLARQETSGWLGSTKKSRQRRWELSIDTFLAGLTRS